MASERIDNLIISRRASGIISPNRIVAVDVSSELGILQAVSPLDTLLGVAYFMGRTFRRYQYQSQSDFVPSSNPGEISIQGESMPSAIRGDMVDVVVSGIAKVEYGATISVGQAVTSSAEGKAIPAFAGSNVIGISTVSGTAGSLGSILITPTKSYVKTSIPTSLPSDVATIPLDSSMGLEFSLLLTDNKILDVPANPTNGADIRLFVTQDSVGGRTLTLPAGLGGFAFSSDVVDKAFSTAADTTDVLEATYSALIGKWLVTNFRKGYA